MLLTAETSLSSSSSSYSSEDSSDTTSLTSDSEIESSETDRKKATSTSAKGNKTHGRVKGKITPGMKVKNLKRPSYSSDDASSDAICRPLIKKKKKASSKGQTSCSDQDSSQPSSPEVESEQSEQSEQSEVSEEEDPPPAPAKVLAVDTGDASQLPAEEAGAEKNDNDEGHGGTTPEQSPQSDH